MKRIYLATLNMLGQFIGGRIVAAQGDKLSKVIGDSFISYLFDKLRSDQLLALRDAINLQYDPSAYRLTKAEADVQLAERHMLATKRRIVTEKIAMQHMAEVGAMNADYVAELRRGRAEPKSHTDNVLQETIDDLIGSIDELEAEIERLKTVPFDLSDVISATLFSNHIVVTTHNQIFSLGANKSWKEVGSAQVIQGLSTELFKAAGYRPVSGYEKVEPPYDIDTYREVLRALNENAAEIATIHRKSIDDAAEKDWTDLASGPAPGHHIPEIKS